MSNKELNNTQQTSMTRLGLAMLEVTTRTFKPTLTQEKPRDEHSYAFGIGGAHFSPDYPEWMNHHGK